MRLRISARKSDLARLQAYMVGDALKEKNPQIEIDYRFRESLGDKNLTDPLWKIPEKGVFTEDFFGELLRDETDLVVHSWKDLPTEHKSETVIAATLPRADQRDLLLVKKSHFDKIKTSKTLKVFSSSPRREYNLTGFFKEHLPFGLQDVKFESVRGNMLTRVRKLIESPETDGLIVAKAAFDRLFSATLPEFLEGQQQLRQYFNELNWVVLPLSVNPNAAAQGALAVEVLKSRQDLQDLLQSIHHADTFHCSQKERDVLSSFGGGCHQKIGVAVLARPYGQITLLKGLTDAGQVLDKRELKLNNPAPQFAAQDLWSSEVTAEREALKSYQIPAGTNGLFVARSEAWPADLKWSDFVWTAGLKTWKNLSQKGIWVHGCAESLGEQEEALMDILAGKKLAWAKLSHEDGYASDQENMTLVPTYTLKAQQEYQNLSGKKFYFWSSGSQFLKAAEQEPGILSQHHASGPGNTHKVIRSYLEENKNYDPKRLHVFLDQEDWRKQCTK
ncbi:hydroxymethylbilane synthase [Bdellovibrio bacteriovorus]|uniref:Hydroxymethylbilane synthase n=1 Tax=Bdellovibrio bacteriovorus (strain ATCC 15356 / DSM 50701 / NCIMB 9529 / HD100) TaxID=264462 RepID=Q6MHU0_BDEBA|nr:hydroxymethylbilane synthase [Bdellovibrio bacteriovorus]AHZ83803.1 hydroxymethylbilane synthase [Bdellovibrio bacteriovorus]BEV69776.1 Porphobilinogen deaminase [Bdellovibrio bacteriovorus]CAE78242.1 hydroxymethylbilane synthase [Bdellovibrio bacteriovorus HD100]